MTGWRVHQRGGLADPGEPWFWCNTCPSDQKWKAGGPLVLAKHVRIEHGLDEWPVTESIIETETGERFVLDLDGKVVERDGVPVRASADVTGLIKTRAKTGRVSRYRDPR